MQTMNTTDTKLEEKSKIADMTLYEVKLLLFTNSCQYKEKLIIYAIKYQQLITIDFTSISFSFFVTYGQFYTSLMRYSINIARVKKPTSKGDDKNPQREIISTNFIISLIYSQQKYFLLKSTYKNPNKNLQLILSRLLRFVYKKQKKAPGIKIEQIKRKGMTKAYMKINLQESLHCMLKSRIAQDSPLLNVRHNKPQVNISNTGMQNKLVNPQEMIREAEFQKLLYLDLKSQNMLGIKDNITIINGAIVMITIFQQIIVLNQLLNFDKKQSREKVESFIGLQKLCQKLKTLIQDQVPQNYEEILII
ncbi:transmembrane protein, putative (macronuclear) [Tetrahymena thermophila SB210]|uniref:Transmembrane protein, putative n=1 Tax=Tetrahymena thermophila (strain SB210) TaxID=312017 RepID=W7XIL6_TETTS|nr:transmembrane protein, putative [Tetrahymena thermophila SB210]EWS74751.1 transmembrane protein, putative [Tetrahymena thermophila SB210]|eukprot:XP_012652752.1 transmembrane protein, putative [Tetrahymena thermophila SB210]